MAKIDIMKNRILYGAALALLLPLAACDFNSAPDLSAQGSENGHEWVDLGLPSGTLWATCNLGAASPEAYGDYIEGLPKEQREDDDYVWELLQSEAEVLPEEVDQAAVRWGGAWRTPSLEQLQELMQHATFTWYSKGAFKGFMVTGDNQHRIFWPAAGTKSDDGVETAGRIGQYWTRTIDRESSSALRILNFGMYDCGTASCDWMYGLSVRPVLKH